MDYSSKRSAEGGEPVAKKVKLSEPSGSNSEDDTFVADPVGMRSVVGGVEYNDAASIDDELTSVADNSKDVAPQETKTVLNTLRLSGASEHDYEGALLSAFKSQSLAAAIKSFAIKHAQDPLSRAQASGEMDVSQHDVNSYADHDPDITERWDELVADIKKASGGQLDEQYLVKPSGPLNAILTCHWHYPTFKTKRVGYGHVMDHTNASLQFQHQKTGYSPFIRTQDSVPIRQGNSDKTPWNEYVSGWGKIEPLLDKFNKWMNRHSKFVILLRKENFNQVYSKFHLEPTEEMIDAALRMPEVGVLFEQHLHAKVIRKKETKAICQVIFFVPHGASFYYGTQPSLAAYTDLVWNALCQMCSIDIVRETCFLGFMSKAEPSAEAKAAEDPEARREAKREADRKRRANRKAQTEAGNPAAIAAREAKREADRKRRANEKAQAEAGNPAAIAAREAEREAQRESYRKRKADQKAQIEAGGPAAIAAREAKLEAAREHKRKVKADQKAQVEAGNPDAIAKREAEREYQREYRQKLKIKQQAQVEAGNPDAIAKREASREYQREYDRKRRA
ncbi:hypothetical protein PG984_003719 [Apiospora sp. TS-2023a]